MLELLTAFANALGICISKLPDWNERMKADYFKRLSRYNALLAKDKRYVDQEELLKCQDDLRNFITIYFPTDLKK